MKQYINQDKIIGFNEPISGVTFKNGNKSVLNVKFIPTDKFTTIANIFTNKGDYIGTDDGLNYQLDVSSGEIVYNLNETFNKFSINSGSYKIGFSIVEFISECNIIEVSPDKTEIKINKIHTALDRSIIDYSIRFGGYRHQIVNIWSDQDFTYLKFINEIEYSGQKVYFVYDYTDEIFDSINIFKILNVAKPKRIAGPKFDIDADQMNTELSVFKCWEELLSTDQVTSQNIIDSMFNSDNSVTLNVDWSYFENYIFYSKAESRINIFYDKILIIEEFQNKISDLDSIIGAEETISQHESAIKTIILNFDAFERYLYYINDPKIFTHETIGPVKPWPKQIVLNEIQLLNSNHVTVQTWYNNLIILAKNFDLQNTRSLWYSIPEHILMVDGNSQYVLFVEMVGHHFDNIWLYVNALTEIHNKDEHPERGPAKELLTSIAESFGWKLANNRNISDLWLYKLGLSESGDSLDIENMFSHELQSQQVWRRIINNLPHLLKTKGSYRSISALMSIYGIPSTLISTKEYGGTEFNDDPIHIEDRYHYKLRLNTDRSLNFLLPLGNEFLENNCYTLIKNGDFNQGLLGWTIEVLPGDDYPEIIVIDNPSNIFDNAPVGTNIIKFGNNTRFSTNLNLELNKKYEFTIHAYSDVLTTFDLEIGGESVTYDINDTPVTIQGSFINSNIDEKFEIFTADDDIYVWNISIEEIAYETRFPDTYEFRFQYDYQMVESSDLFTIIKTNPGDPEGINFVEKYIFNFTPVDDRHRKLNIFKQENLSTTFLHQSVTMPFDYDEFYTFRLFRSLDDPAQFHYNIAIAGDSLFGDIKHEISGNITIASLLFNDGYEFVMKIKYSGWIQGYKEYYGNYSYDTFKEHVLNPGEYSTDEFNGSYNKLVTYYPFGLDLQRFTHLSTHASSQPNRNFIPSVLTMTGFSNTDQTLNYDNDVETYYIDSPMIGGRNIYSKKIRIVDNLIDSPVLSNIRLPNANKFVNNDTNRLAIVFSLADQINRDIFNHINGDDLNNSIGSPLDEFESRHKDLDRLRSLYFKKYQSRNDINTFIRLLSAYDYTFFDQIKQLVPGSANLIAGILIEPHILERNKQVTIKRPEITVNHIELKYDLNTNKEHSDITQLETIFKHVDDIDIAILKLQTELKRNIDLDLSISRIKLLLELNYEVMSKWFKCIKGNNIRLNVAGVGGLETMIDNPRIDCRYSKKIPIYTDENRNEYSIYKYLDIDDPTSSGVTGGYVFSDLTKILNVDNRPFIRYLTVSDALLTGAAPKSLDIPFENIILPAGKYICRFYIEWLNGTGSIEGNAISEIDITGATVSGSGGFGLRYTPSDDIRVINPYYLEITTDEDDTVDITLSLILLDGVTTGSTFRIYGFDIYDYKTLYQRELFRLNNQLNLNKQHEILKPTSYQNDEYSVSNNSRFVGSKITSPGWNLPSNDTLDKEPVVEFNYVDPLVMTVFQGNDSNIKVN